MKHIIPQSYTISSKARAMLKGHQPLLLWFTGLSGSGKSTIANGVEEVLHKNGIHTYTLDGDNVRGGLNKNLSFSPEDRTENIRRIAEVANLMLDAGLVVLAAFVSPYVKDRDNVKSIVGADRMVEVFVDTPLEECERRDVKGLYAKARAGEIKNFTGIDAPYEQSAQPEITIKTTETTINEAVQEVVAYIETKIRPNG
ncbi:MAG: adenylyl-sulfate kinase [Marinirhabdus sp.]|nr:adenylyl-sulfate kinase [Marinirhabdus sp.]